MSNIRISILILFSCSLILLISCEKESSLTDRKAPQSILNNSEQRAIMDTSKMIKRDGIPVISTSGAKIDKNKVDKMLKRGNVAYCDIVLAKKTKAIKQNIEKLKKLLQKQNVLNDNELRFSVHAILGTQFLRMYKQSEKNVHLRQATNHTDSAISIFENQPEYKADLAPVYMGRVGEYSSAEKYDKAISLMKFLIEEYQDIGYGEYKNWFAAYQVDGLYNLARNSHSKSGNGQESQGVVDYLAKIAEKYDNEVGITAQIVLSRHYLNKGEQSRVKVLSESIESRLVSLDNPAFKKDKWERFKTYREQMKKREVHQNH